MIQKLRESLELSSWSSWESVGQHCGFVQKQHKQKVLFVLVSNICSAQHIEALVQSDLFRKLRTPVGKYLEAGVNPNGRKPCFISESSPGVLILSLGTKIRT